MKRKAARYTKGVASWDGMQEHQLEVEEYARKWIRLGRPEL